MTGYYDLLEKLRATLVASPSINTVTTGDLLEVDLAKQTIFPLAHLIIQNATFSDHVITFSVSILFADIVEFSKNDPRSETAEFFRGNNNEQDVHNAMLGAANELWTSLSRGTIFSDKYQIEGAPTAEPFVERFDNMLAGWDVTFNISIPNSEINACV
jgi:hypothetical protein